MSQAIAGIAPVEDAEVTVMTVWPSVAGMRLMGFPLGRILGDLLNVKAGFYVFTLGNLFALLALPVGMILYLKRVGPFVATRYRVTNKRIVVERGLTFVEERAVTFDNFDRIDVETQSGDSWYKAGDLVFRQGDVERFRLEGVSRPESFRQICWKSRQAYVGVKDALANA